MFSIDGSHDSTSRPDCDFTTYVENLNEYATGEESAYAIGQRFGRSSPTNALKRMWGNREYYREARRTIRTVTGHSDSN